MSKIKIEGMQFYAYHGCFEEERLVGTNFIVDCILAVNAREAAHTDSLEKTIDYQQVYQVIAKEMEQTSFLLENVAYRILKSLHVHFPTMTKTRVSVKKMNPPLGGKVESVKVEMGMEEVLDKQEYKKRKVENKQKIESYEK